MLSAKAFIQKFSGSGKNRNGKLCAFLRGRFGTSPISLNVHMFSCVVSRFRAAILRFFCWGCRNSRVTVMEPNCTALQTPGVQFQQLMVPRSPVLCPETMTTRLNLNEGTFASSDNLERSRYKEVLLDERSGLRIYSLE